MNKIKIVEFYDTGVCESEPKWVEKLSDEKALCDAFLSNIENLETDHVLEVRIKEVTEKDWEDAVKYGEENA
jgi:hypothetical protein